MRTGHPGVGRCWKHGGKSPIKHGIYSETMSGRGRIRELIDGIDKATEDIEDLRPETILLKALVSDYVERYEDQTRALEAWHQTHDPVYVALMAETDAQKAIDLVVQLRKINLKRPRQLPDPVGISTIIDRIRKMVESLHKIGVADAMPRQQVVNIIKRLAVVVARNVPDELMQKIETEWRAIPE